LPARPQRRSVYSDRATGRDGDRSVPRPYARVRAGLCGGAAGIEFLSRHTRADAGMGGRALSRGTMRG
jgi:hypothetical protein